MQPIPTLLAPLYRSKGRANFAEAGRKKSETPDAPGCFGFLDRRRSDSRSAGGLLKFWKRATRGGAGRGKKSFEMGGSSKLEANSKNLDLRRLQFVVEAGQGDSELRGGLFLPLLFSSGGRLYHASFADVYRIRLEAHQRTILTDNNVFIHNHMAKPTAAFNDAILHNDAG